MASSTKRLLQVSPSTVGLLLLSIFFNLLQLPISTEGGYYDVLRNLSCYTCEHTLQAPNDECANNKSTPDPLALENNNRQFKVSKTDKACYTCSITQGFKNGELSSFSRRCIVSNVTGVGCFYWYPPGTGEVIESCRCDSTYFCNNGTIEQIGGKGDPTKFPKDPYLKFKEKSRGGRHLSHRFTPLLAILVLLLLTEF